MCKRCYLRGTSPLGLFNTVIGCIFNRVLVQMRDTETGKVLGSYLDQATRHGPESDDGDKQLRTRTSSIPKAIYYTVRWSLDGLKKNLSRIRSSEDSFIDKLHELALVIKFFPASIGFHYRQCRGPVYTDKVMDYLAADNELNCWRWFRVNRGEVLDSLPNDTVMTETCGN